MMQIALNKIYGLPASVTIISGLWKRGKTDFALLLSELTSQLGLVSQFASNIETNRKEPFVQVQFINNFTSLDHWFYSTPKRKMFLYDETVESSPKRGAMTSLNVGWVKRIPQLSKARCHLIAICQEETLADSIFVNPTFCRGIWRKLDKKSVLLHSHLFDKTLRWGNIPKTNILFDPYLVATFKMSEVNINLLPPEYQVVKLYGEGKSFGKIKEELGLPDYTDVKRKLTRACKTLTLALLQSITEGNKVPELCKSEDQ